MSVRPFVPAVAPDSLRDAQPSIRLSFAGVRPC